MMSKSPADENEATDQKTLGLDRSAREREAEALRQSEERYRNVYDTAPLAFVIWDRQCRITDWNRRAEQMFGWTREEVLGRDFFQFLIPEGTKPQVREVVDGLLRGELPSRSVNENRTKNGEIILCEWNNSILYNREGHVEGAMSLALDITESKEAEETILKSSEKFKQFAYSVMHDLKSPAIGIHGLADLLYKQYGEALEEKGRKYCEQILKASIHLSALVEMINGYIAAKEAELRLDSIDVKEVLKTVREQFAPRLLVRQIEWIEPEALPKIKADRLSIYRILSNLVDNALKYGGEDLSEIRIGYEESEELHTFSVSDNGAGIEERDLKRIFSQFQRGVTPQAVEGTGLGLAIVRELAERHGGEIWTEPGRDQGATFYVSLSKSL